MLFNSLDFAIYCHVLSIDYSLCKRIMMGSNKKTFNIEEYRILIRSILDKSVLFNHQSISKFSSMKIN